MPRKNKKSTKPFNSNFDAPKRAANGEVFRNFFAIDDEVDPRVSLQYVKEVFRGKVEEDVVNMIFSECAYDVGLTVETLFTLSNDKHYTASDPCLPTSSISHFADPSIKTSCPEDYYFFPENVPTEATDNTGREKGTTTFNSLSALDSTSSTSSGIKESYSEVLYSHGNLFNDQNFINKGQNLAAEDCAFFSPVTDISTRNQVALQPEYLPGNVQYNDVMAVPKKGEIKFSPCFDNSTTVQKPMPYTSKGRASPLRAHSSSPNFITPYVPFRGKATSSHGMPPSRSKSYSGFAKTSTVSSRKKSNSASCIVNDISSKIIDRCPVMILLRGLPGSGKSTLAEKLKFSGVSLSTDDFFIKNDVYEFDFRKLSEAHEWNKGRTLNALQLHITPIIIDNTNTEAWEMLPYVKLALQFHYEIFILEPNTPWKFKPGKLAVRNSHGVPREKIERMLERYDHTITVKSLISMLGKSKYKKGGSSSSSSSRESPKRDKNDKYDKKVLKDFNHIDELQISSTESLLEDSSVDSKLISSEVEVHQEQDDHFEDFCAGHSEKLQQDDDDITVKCSDDQIHLSDKTSCMHNWSDIDDIDKLKLLMREESEESQSCGQVQQSSDSSQEISGWEAITERDEDFLWSSGSSGNHTTSDSRNANGLHRIPGNICFQQPGLHEVSNETDYSPSSASASEEFIIPLKNSLDGKTAGSQHEAVPENLPEKDKNHDTDSTGSSSKQSEVVSDCDWIVDCNDAFHSWNGKVSDEANDRASNQPLEPKPQRQALKKSVACNQLNESNIGTPASNLNMKKHETPLPLLSFGSVTNEWMMPSFKFECNDEELWGEKSEAKKVVQQASFQTQTEPCDFVLCHKLQTNALFVTSLKTLKPSHQSAELGSYTPEEYISDNIKEIEIPLSFQLDKSTSTSEVSQSMENDEKMMMLHSCFPEISEDDLCHLLDLCHGDNIWLSNILLDWGYKYNVPNAESCSETLTIGSTQESKPAINELSVNDCKANTSSNSAYEQTSSNCVVQSNSMNADSSDKKLSVIDGNDLDYSHTIGHDGESPTLNLVLSSNLASDLQKQFGPIFENPFDISEQQRTITLDSNLAQILFNKWKETVTSLNSEGSERRQGNDSRAIPPKIISAPSIKMKTSAEINQKSIAEISCRRTSEPSSLSEIMQMEYAIQLSRKEKLKQEQRNGNNLATRVKRTELHRMFPGVDTVALDEVFESHNCNLENTLLALEADIGKPAKITPDPSLACESSVLQDFSTDNWTDWVHEDGFLNKEEAGTSAESTPEAEHWRAEAAKHFQIHLECVGKAQSAFFRSMGDVASFYSQKGSFHKMKFKEANKIASELIVQNKNACLSSQVLDLHGLHVQEAIPQLRKFLKSSFDRMNPSMADKRQLAVTVITGRGAHSIRGARLRPSVINFLNSSGYRFDEINLGVFNISLSPPQQA